MIGHEGIGTAYIQSGHTEDFVGIVFSSLFEHFGSNGYSGVDGIANDGYHDMLLLWCVDGENDAESNNND